MSLWYEWRRWFSDFSSLGLLLWSSASWLIMHSEAFYWCINLDNRSSSASILKKILSPSQTHMFTVCCQHLLCHQVDAEDELNFASLNGSKCSLNAAC